MALTNDPKPEQQQKRKPGRPRKAPQDVEVRADLDAERELESEPEPEYITYRYVGPEKVWIVVVEDGAVDVPLEVLPNGEITLHNVRLPKDDPNFVRVNR